MYVGSQRLMQDYDQALIDEGYAIEDLVDKASDCLMKHVKNYHRISLLCGSGNNGADGLSLALKLDKLGKDVHVYIFEKDRLSQANRYYLNQCYHNHLSITLFNEQTLDECILQILESDVVVDGIFGFGLKGSPKGIYQAVIDELNRLYKQDVLSIDIPTGLNCNSGIAYQSVVCATHTITLTALKNGFLNPDSMSFTGTVTLEKLDVADMSEKVGLYQLVDFEYASSLLKDRRFDGHKGNYGRVAMISGCDHYKGAALLCSKSAVYSGSGVVTTISEQDVLNALVHYCPEVTTMLRPPILQGEDLKKYDALLIGSGLGLELESYRYVIDVLSKSEQPLVIDGDALTILSNNLDLLLKKERSIVLTPHMAEFKRLCDFHEEDDILYIAREFAKKWHITLVLKGPYTIVTNGIDSFRVMAGNKAMASGGMGDVLSGMITSFLGQGYDALNASLLGVYIHGLCGDELAKNAYTVIPSQLIEIIPKMMAKLKK